MKPFWAAFAVRIVLIHVICLRAFPASDQNANSKLPPAGQVGTVTCLSDSSESYSLYLPSRYTEQKRWPILYLFDPVGRGKRPVELYKDIAEKYGFLLAGSNNSRNFSSEQSRNLSAFWQDTHRRLSLDVHRTYTGGFSGGARVAGLMATSCVPCQIAGVIANGAGYAASRPQGDKLLYFFAVGDQDFNWPEVMNVRREREDAGLQYRVRVFSGPHQWPPAEVIEDAVEWLQLKAMQTGALPRDSDFIAERWRVTMAEADDAEKNSHPIAQLNALRSLVTDFAGLKDTSDASRKLASLKSSAALRAALKDELQQVAEQSEMEGQILPKIDAYISGNADDSAALQDSIQQEMRRLDDQSEHAKSEIRKLVSRRAAAGVWIAAGERGEQELASNHFPPAENCFLLMSRMRNEFWPLVMLADTHAAEGKPKQAIQDLREAMRRGLKDSEIVASDDRLRVLKDNPDFQKLLEELARK